MSNSFRNGMGGTPARTAAEAEIENLRKKGGLFVEAVRVTRMPMAITAATLPGNPIGFANKAFENLSGYPPPELLGQGPHFLVAVEQDEEAAEQFAEALARGREDLHELTLYRKDRAVIRSAVFLSPVHDDDGAITHHFRPIWTSPGDLRRRNPSDRWRRIWRQKRPPRHGSRKRPTSI